MKVSSRVLQFARSAGLTLILASGPLAACADSGGSDSLDDTASNLKGGVPSNSHGKGKATGDAAGSGPVVEDAGVAGKGNDKDKPKKDKTTKTHGKSGGAAGGDEAAAGDQAAGDDTDEAADETP